ncbi:LuxR C-terminal-related transcriptional regulator [Cohnella sp. 56]|uniref:LuxR C-terminal-related transcriptional regulator n=1 Tax=Cohnella sp. 56 TaxID=3113722 RepID=UPI0030EABD79
MFDLFDRSFEKKIWRGIATNSTRSGPVTEDSSNENLPSPEAPHRLQQRQHRNGLLIRCTLSEILKWENLIPVPHLFLLTDTEGIAIYIHSRQELREALNQVGLMEGVSFSRERLGINGVSMAMEQQAIVAVREREHELEVFWPFNCLCVPIRDGRKVVGYLDLSFSHRHEIEFAVPILLRIVDKIEGGLSGAPSENGKLRLFELFDQHGLTPREKEAAYGWLCNYSVLRIAEEMKITEGTVRNMIKKVYAKTKINDKGQFIRTFTGVL